MTPGPLDKLGALARAAWDAATEGKLPDAPVLSTGEDIGSPCSLCRGRGTLDVDGVTIECNGPKCVRARGTVVRRKELPR